MAELAEHSDLLASLPLFEGVPIAELRAAAATSRLRRYPRGQLVFTTGDPSDSLLVTVTGRIKVVVRSADGGELILAIVGPGGIIGEIGVVDGGPRSANAETLDATEVLLMPSAVVMELLGRHPTMSLRLLKSVTANLRRLTDATADLVFLDLPRRVAKTILDHPRDAQGVVDLRMSQEQLAHRVAGTRQSVNQALRGFERRGWIQINGQSIVVRSPVDLARFAGADLSAR